LEGRVLIVEDKQANSEVLRQSFEEAGFEVTDAATGEEGFNLATRLLPQVIIVSTSLPDMMGTELTQRLRSFVRTQHIFLMMLADDDIHSQRLSVLELGANDFVVSPFDPVEVTLRVRNALRRANMSNRTDPTTGLPAGTLVQDQLRRLVMENPEGAWTLIRFRVANLEPFREVHGFMAADDLLRAVARILAEALNRDSVANDFLGYGGNDNFIAITTQERAPSLVQEAKQAFKKEVRKHYEYIERDQGYIVIDGKQAPLATIQAHLISPEDGPFYDIRTLTEALSG